MSAKSIVAVSCLLVSLAVPLAAAGRRPHGDVHVTVLQTTDIHDHANGNGHVGLDVDPTNGTAAIGAYSRVAAYVDFVRATAGHPVVLVDSGDWTMGTIYDFTLGSSPLALRFLKLMRYDAVTLGNHEFDYTPAGLALMLASAQGSFGFHIPIVASNMSLGGEPHLQPFVGPGKLIQTSRVETLAGGLRVGFLGLMGHSAAVDAAASAPVSFAIDYAAIQQQVNALRHDRGVQVVIVLSHSGTSADGTSGEDVELARHVNGIDVIASGHSHTPLPAARAVANGGWTTQIIDAGAFGTNVARIDLTFHARSGTVSVDGSSNVAMTDASLAALRPWLEEDAGVAALVHGVDLRLNQELGPFFGATFPDYDPANLATGIYHPVGTATQEMAPNDRDPVLAPNGMGNLAADGVRNTANAIVAQALAAVGGDPANLPGYDFQSFQGTVVATGVLRGALAANVPLTFADIYDELSLGISPDVTQALPIGFPTLSAYLAPPDLAKLCALQLVGQSNLIDSSFYLNLSGLECAVYEPKAYDYFKTATAAAVLSVTSNRAAAGSTVALQALGALAALPVDDGAALVAAMGAGNPYATAMVKLNDAAPTNQQLTANLIALGQVAAAAAADAAHHTTTLPALLVARAIDAIAAVNAFAPNDLDNTGNAAPILTGARLRVVADLYAILLLGAVNAQFGIEITPYANATGGTVLSPANFPALLANRIDADPAHPGVQELKEWMGLLGYVTTGLHGTIGPAYASTPDFTQFPTFGPAVTVRNASYPLADVGMLAATVGALQHAP